MDSRLSAAGLTAFDSQKPEEAQNRGAGLPSGETRRTTAALLPEELGLMVMPPSGLHRTRCQQERGREQHRLYHTARQEHAEYRP